MDIQQIKNFLILSQELHFWRTAGMINITQSALSRQIQGMEEELGVSLFERNKRNVTLTPSGLYLKEKWTVLLDELNHVQSLARQISTGETGHIKIAHPDSISSSLIPDVIARLNERYPELTVELIQLIFKNIEDSLQDLRLDLAFTRQVSKLPGICSQKLLSQPLALFVPENSSIASPEDITVRSLTGQRFILPVAERKSQFYFVVQEVFQFYGIAPCASYYSDFGSSMLGLVSRGLCMAILPSGFAHHGSPGLRAIKIPFSSELYLSWRKDEKNPALLNVINLIFELFYVSKLPVPSN